MKRRLRSAFWIPALLACGAVQPLRAAEGCAPTPEAAVLRGMGLGAVATGRDGFRVRDVIVDPLLQRSFVRVESCGTVRRLPILLPFAAVHSNGSERSETTRSSAFLVQPSTPVQIAMTSDHAAVLLTGKTLAAAAVGGMVTVLLPSLQEGAVGRTLRGRLTSAHRVEVEP